MIWISIDWDSNNCIIRYYDNQFKYSFKDIKLQYNLIVIETQFGIITIPKEKCIVEQINHKEDLL